MSKDFIGPTGEGIHFINTGDWRIRTPLLDQASCRRCGICLMYCPVNSISREADGSYLIHLGFCKGCGICARECPSKAIAMEREAST